LEIVDFLERKHDVEIISAQSTQCTLI